MRKLALAFAFCLVALLSTAALSAAEIPAPPAPQPAVALMTPVLPSPLPAFMASAAPTGGCPASLLSLPQPTNLTTGCGECDRRSQCPPCPFGCIKDCDGFGCCVCYCS